MSIPKNSLTCATLFTFKKERYFHYEVGEKFMRYAKVHLATFNSEEKKMLLVLYE
jgi:hypothetical protein